MKERDFRSKLMLEFNKVKAPGRFIWAHDSHFKAGFPDLYWVIGGKSRHAELKLVKDKQLPQDPWSLCTKIQQKIIQDLYASGASVYLFVAHVPPRGPKQVVIAYPYVNRLTCLTWTSFWASWPCLSLEPPIN